MGRCGFYQAELLTLHEKLGWNFPNDGLLALLELLKVGYTWDALSAVHGCAQSTIRSQVTAVLDASNWDLDPTIRFDPANVSELSRWYSVDAKIKGLMDVTPVFTNQSKANPSLYTGKFKRACWKFEVWTTNLGVPFWCRGPFPGASHDQAILASPAYPSFPHLPGEHFLADKAYTLPRHLIVPRKKSHNKPLTEVEESFLAWHRKCRAKVEHFFGRMKRFSFVDDAKGFREAFIAKAFRFLLWCFQALAAIPPQKRPSPLCNCDMKP
jgi:hypothetical protein